MTTAQEIQEGEHVHLIECWHEVRR